MKEVAFLVGLAAAVSIVGNKDKDSWRFAFWFPIIRSPYIGRRPQYAHRDPLQLTLCCLGRNLWVLEDGEEVLLKEQAHWRWLNEVRKVLNGLG